jgi:hypothetical protein
MAIRNSKHFIKLSTDFIYAESTKVKYRVHKNDFTRRRKLHFEVLVLCMLRLLRKTIQLELNSFFKSLSSSAQNSVKHITSSAFVQSRKKIRSDLFYDLNGLIAQEYYKDNDEKVKLYKGHRVLSIDGSTVNLPPSKELKLTYGGFDNQNKIEDIATARVSVLYDVLNEIVLDGKMCSIKTGEVPLSRKHLQHAKKGDLIIMDRAYPSFESAYLMQQQGVEFLYRCKHNFSNQVFSFFQSGTKEKIVEIKTGQNKSFKNLPYNKNSSIRVRLIRIVLDSGEIEILMTSLLDNKKYLYKEFKELYFKRWSIEKFYNRFKNVIGIERFSGTSDHFIQQEFNCALYISNIQTILTEDAQIEADKKYEHRKYDYKINSSLSLGFIREKLVQLFTEKKMKANDTMEELKELFVLNVVPIRSGRNYERKTNKYRQRTTPKQFLNQRIIF